MNDFFADDQLLLRCPKPSHLFGILGYSEFIQALSKDQEVRPAMFKNYTACNLAPNRRFPAPRIADEVGWVATDAAPEVVGVAGRPYRHYWKLHAGEITKPFVEEDWQLPGIDDKGMMGLVVGGVAGFASHPRKRAFRLGW